MAVCSAGSTADRRLVSGFEWLVDTVVDQYDGLSERVMQDVRLRTEREARERQERMERVRRIRQERYYRNTFVGYSEL